MTEPTRPTYDDLERELAALARVAAFPPTPDLTAGVRTRLTERPRSLARRPDAFWRAHRFLVAAAIVLLLLASLASGRVRHAVGSVLGVPGIRIEFVHRTPTAEPSPIGVTIGLGEPSTLTAATTAAAFPVKVPDPSVYGAPDGVYLRLLPDGGYLVSLLYAPDARLPEAAETGTGMLLMQFQSTDQLQFLLKSVMGDGYLREVAFAGTNGYWVEGTSELTILDNPAVATCCARRPSANVLIWQAGGVTYRLETALSLDDALAIAQGLAPKAP